MPLLSSRSSSQGDVACQYCGGLYTRSGLSRHLAQSRRCQVLEQDRVLAFDPSVQQLGAFETPASEDEDLEDEKHMSSQGHYQNQLAEDFLSRVHPEEIQPISFPEFPSDFLNPDFDNFDSDTNELMAIDGNEDQPSSDSQGLEEESRKSHGVAVTPFLGKEAGFAYSRQETNFERWERAGKENPNIFDQPEIWEIAYWLMNSGLSGAHRDKFLKLDVSRLFSF